MRTLLRINLGCSVMLGVLFMLALLLGRGQPTPAWRPLMDCPQPCWAGIQPGHITISEARRILRDQYHLENSGGIYMIGSEPGQAFHFTVLNLHENANDPSSNLLPYLNVRPLSALRTGDLLLAFGPPSEVMTVDGCIPADVGTPRQCGHYFILVFGQQSFQALVRANLGGFSPGDVVRLFDFASDADYLMNGGSGWKGFASFSRYPPWTG